MTIPPAIIGHSLEVTQTGLEKPVSHIQSSQRGTAGH
jgi:hypothetical protein